MADHYQQEKTQSQHDAALKVYSIFGEGGWIDKDYVLASCPLCGMPHSFQFAGLSGVWSCISCGKNGEFRDLMDVLKADPIWFDRIDELKQPTAPEGLIQLGKYMPPRPGQTIATGFTELDMKMGGLAEGALTILSGKRGQGKSTIACQFALNIIHNGGKVCFYSGELSAAIFQGWVVKQAAGSKYLNKYVDPFGAERYHVEPIFEGRIKSWLTDRFILYDNAVSKSSERNAILDRFLLAKKYYDCRYFFVDNLMTAKYTKDEDRDYFRQQSNFAGELTDFAMQEHSHVILVAHPKKGESGDFNDDVSGLSDITNRASNVFYMQRLDEKDRARLHVDFDNILHISKNREHGYLGELGLDFKADSKRYVPATGRTIERYAWEDEI